MSYQLRIFWQGREIAAEAEAGERLMEALTRAGVTLSAPCGGRGVCGKCHVRLEGDAGEIAPEECRALSEAELEAGWRLACLAQARSDLTVWAEEARASVLVEGGVAERGRLDPPLRLVEATLPAPSLADQRSDQERLLSALGAEDARLDWRLLAAVPELIRRTGRVSAALFAGEAPPRLTALSPERLRALGVAVDIGTTTMAAFLLDLATGEELASASMLNPQRPCGGDVITRAEYAAGREDGAERLAELARGAIRDMTERMAREAGVSVEDVRHYTLVGNTMMMHLLAKLETRHIAQLPFVPVYTRATHVSAEALTLPGTGAVATLGPCVSGYVGADTIAALLACDMDEKPGLSLMIDIGTNGEIALGGRERLLCCSAAAGPAFEGAHIRCGSGAVSGAIDRVRIYDGRVDVTTIGGQEAVSICGSGIVDAVAQMLDAGILDETGRIDEDEIPEEYEDRLFDGDDGLCFRLTEKVFICQKDIREVQLAKAAIAAGIRILMDKAGAQDQDIQALYLAGGFGNFIDQRSACRIGLLPAALLERIRPIGNGAGAGARRMLLEREALRRAERLHGGMEYVELSASAEFQELFAENMLFEDE